MELTWTNRRTRSAVAAWIRRSVPRTLASRKSTQRPDDATMPAQWKITSLSSTTFRSVGHCRILPGTK
jgi:hypothetical protein